MPLILENSPDAQMLIPMAIALAYGILFGTVFILIILPVLIVLTNRATVIIKSIGSKEKIEPESVETAVINAEIEKTLNKNMAKQFE
jgi:hypothetical protein